MKYILIVFVFLRAGFAFGQDTIVQKNGTSIPAKVLEIDKTDVKYKKFENPDGPSYILPKSDVSMIRYQNGSVDSFNIVSSVQKTPVIARQQSEMYLKGYNDAGTHYMNYKPAAQWTLGLTVPLNAFGILPAVIFSSTPPKKENLNYPDESLTKNQEYLAGYVAGAKSKKGSKVMKNFLWGALASFAIYGTLVATGALHP
jgi:hypothetical protein